MSLSKSAHISYNYQCSYVDLRAEWERLNTSGKGEDKKPVLMLKNAFDAIEADCRVGVYIQKKKISKYYT